jgi:hypothetical protein
VDDAAVVAGLVLRHGLLALEHHDAGVRAASLQLAGDCEAQDAASDNRKVAFA